MNTCWALSSTSLRLPKISANDAKDFRSDNVRSAAGTRVHRQLRTRWTRNSLLTGLIGVRLHFKGRASVVRLPILAGPLPFSELEGFVVAVSG